MDTTVSPRVPVIGCDGCVLLYAIEGVEQIAPSPVHFLPDLVRAPLAARLVGDEERDEHVADQRPGVPRA